MLNDDGNIAEGPGENIFIVKDKKLCTPKLGSILSGITRDSVITIAKDMGCKVEEKNLSVEEVIQADECFFTGTAAEVTAISSIDGKKIGDGGIGKVTEQIKKIYLDAVHGRNKKYEKWLTFVK